jgi:hypothetical protein
MENGSKPKYRDFCMKKLEKWGVKIWLEIRGILHPAECNSHPNILHLGKAEK